MADAVLSVMATNGMRTSHHIANTIIEHRHDEAWLRQHIHNDAHYNSLMAVIREKEETLKQRVIRALAGFFRLRAGDGCRWRGGDCGTRYPRSLRS
ncbi:Plasmid segregation protein parM (Protein stbA) (ParA locus 36 kDa protein) [Escherichia coli]|nr:Plasmid segregation protein parM (Protein stbA) (ParA locus 36 kDa protein) [Escherichia coli]